MLSGSGARIVADLVISGDWDEIFYAIEQDIEQDVMNSVAPFVCAVARFVSGDFGLRIADRGMRMAPYSSLRNPIFPQFRVQGGPVYVQRSGGLAYVSLAGFQRVQDQSLLVGLHDFGERATFIG